MEIMSNKADTGHDSNIFFELSAMKRRFRPLGMCECVSVDGMLLEKVWRTVLKQNRGFKVDIVDCAVASVVEFVQFQNDIIFSQELTGDIAVW